MRVFSIVFSLAMLAAASVAPAGTVVETYASTVNNVAIPDNGCDDDATGTGLGGISNQITIPVSDTGTIEDINVQVQMNHTWRSDIQASLTDGTSTVRLINNHDGSGDNYFATLDTQAAELCSAAANCGTTGNCAAAPGPTCQPDEALDAFNGAEAGGRTFTLNVCDRALGDTGSLLNWAIEVERTPPPPPPTTVTESYPSTVNNVAIPDNGCVDDATGTGLGGISNQITIPVSDTGSIVDVDVQVQMNHTWRSDIQASLTDGTTTVRLINDHDGSGDNYFATLDTGAAELCSATANCGTGGNCAAAPGPTCQPDEALDAFNGAEAGGRTFTLNVCDRALGDNGSLLNWTLVVDREPTVGVDADLSVAIADSPDPVNAGDNLTWTVTATNNGAGDAENVSVTLPLPADTSFVSASADGGGSCNAVSPVICTWAGTTASGTDRVATIVAAVALSATGPLEATASTSSDTTDGNPANNSASASTVVSGVDADVSVAKVATSVPSPILVGSNIVYQLTASNAGPAGATGVVVTDTLPAELDFVSTDCGADFAAPTLTWNIGALAAGGDAVCNLTVAVAQTGTISNTASVTSTSPDPNPANDSAASVLAGAEITDMAVALTSNAPGGLALGDDFVYTVTGTNNGPGTAFDIDFSLNLPVNVDVVSSSCGAVQSGATLSWNVASLANGASADCQITVLVVVAGDIEASATVASATLDPDPTNNSAVLAVFAAAVPIPTLSGLGLLLLVLMSLAIGMVALRRV